MKRTEYRDFVGGQQVMSVGPSFKISLFSMPLPVNFRMNR